METNFIPGAVGDNCDNLNSGDAQILPKQLFFFD